MHSLAVEYIHQISASVLPLFIDTIVVQEVKPPSNNGWRSVVEIQRQVRYQMIILDLEPTDYSSHSFRHSYLCSYTFSSAAIASCIRVGAMGPLTYNTCIYDFKSAPAVKHWGPRQVHVQHEVFRICWLYIQARCYRTDCVLLFGILHWHLTIGYVASTISLHLHCPLCFSALPSGYWLRCCAALAVVPLSCWWHLLWLSPSSISPCHSLFSIILCAVFIFFLLCMMTLFFHWQM